MDGMRSNHWKDWALSSMSSGEKVTNSIRKHNCVLESAKRSSNRGISVLFTLLMKSWMGVEGNDAHWYSTSPTRLPPPHVIVEMWRWKPHIPSSGLYQSNIKVVDNFYSHRIHFGRLPPC
ncbi:hypothetical protein EYF80_010254 [Liparis tanakae]|uniref:Uncharacterized protein n=1 Tax=Liparis tanakae TaxID=230148 RepID=A0A4Z2IN13_9TELE|nr:hypothetical protein EYF80_010254 [Liparis tanakae]